MMKRSIGWPGYPRPAWGRRACAALALMTLLTALAPVPLAAYSPAPWPTTFNAYFTANGQAIFDAHGESSVSPPCTDIWSGYPQGTSPSVYVTITKTDVFFRMRLQADPRNASGIEESVYEVFVGANGTTVGTLGINGKPGGSNDDYIFIRRASDGALFSIYTFPGGALVGAQVSQESDQGWLLDWQVPLQAIFDDLAVSPSSVLQFFYATSIAASTGTINKDAMLDIGNSSDPVYTNLQTISLRTAFFEITKSYTHVSGPATPQVGSESTYSVTIQVKNSGGNKATNVQVHDPFPNGAIVLDKNSTSGNFTGSSGQDMIWNPGDMNSSATVNATVSVSVTPVASQAGQMISLNTTCTASGSDPVTNETTNATWPGPALEVGPVTTAPAGQQVSGTVYLDDNHNSLMDATESGTGLTLYAKRVPAAGGPAEEAVVVTPASGAYTFTAVANGTYSVVLDDNSTLSDIEPTIPAAYVGTEAPAFTRGFTMNGIILTGVNLGLYHGAKVSGTVFADTGAGGGTANNGVKDGGEVGLAGVTVYARTDALALLDRDVTDALGGYTLFVPDSSNGTSVKVVETNLSNTVSTGGSAGDTGGSYARGTDTVTYTFASGQSRTGVNFGDVPQNTLVPDGMQTGLPGAMVFYRHLYNAGTAGQVTFTTTHTAVPSLTGWSSALYRDENCNGALDGAETLVSGAISVSAGDQLCLLASEFIPSNATVNAQDQLVLTAAFSYTGASPALSGSLSRTDVTMVGTASAAGLLLTKTADLASARPGQTIVYTIAYTNRSKDNLSNVTIQDFTPAYTSFVSAGYGTPPSGITGCTVTTQPSVDGKGALKWTLTGVLKPGLSGTVTYSVKVD